MYFSLFNTGLAMHLNYSYKDVCSHRCEQYKKNNYLLVYCSRLSSEFGGAYRVCDIHQF